MSVIAQNKCGILVHPLPPTPHVYLRLIDKPYGKQPSTPEIYCSKSKTTRKRKKHRTLPLNAGEASMMAYHNKVREKILNSWKSLIELGKEVGYFPVTGSLQDDETVFPLISDSTATKNPTTVLDKDKDDIFKTCLRCTYDNVDLVGACNNNLSVSNPTDRRSAIVIDDDMRHNIYKIENLCGRVVTNSMKNWAIVKLSEHHFAIPQNCTFLLSEFDEFQTLVDYIQCSDNRKYDCIVLDPPWENRSAIRSHKYQWLSEYDLLQLPLPELCNDGCLVVVWVTNKIRLSDFVREELFPSWNVHVVGEWHWVKITTSGELVFNLDSLHKKPYELLLLGRYQGAQQALPKIYFSSNSDELSAAKRPKLSSPVRNYLDYGKDNDKAELDDKHSSASTCAVMSQHQVIVSIPSQYHSQKPYLGNLFGAFLPHNPNCLEMFSRNLQPGWTSWGNEVLKFQGLCVQ